MIAVCLVLIMGLLLFGIYHVGGFRGAEYRARAIMAVVERQEPFTVTCGKSEFRDVIVMSNASDKHYLLMQDYSELIVQDAKCTKNP